MAGALSALLEILDIASLSDGFEIIGGFQSSWRAHVWEGKNRNISVYIYMYRYVLTSCPSHILMHDFILGWLATNIVMLVCHLIMIGYSIVVYFAVKRFVSPHLQVCRTCY